MGGGAVGRDRDTPATHRADRRQRLYWAKFQYRTADDVGGLMKPAVFEFGSGLGKTERGPLIAPGERQT